MPAGAQGRILTLALLGLAGSLSAATRYVEEPQAEACRQWEITEQAVWDGSIDRKDARKRFQELWPNLSITELAPPPEGLWQWVFPLPGYGPDDFSGQSYDPDDFKFYDGPKALGHPAVNIYARDPRRKALDERNDKPIVVVSATSGVVVSARKFWGEGESNPLGIYVCVLSQHEKRFFYYAQLSRLKVGLGQVIDKGQVLGWLGRSGHDLVRKNLGTHLRFEVHSWDDGLFYPVYPGRALKAAERLPWPLPEPDYNKPPKKRRGHGPKK
ncbi:MAG: M23 family metallopeptidase [candidate division FCPU426 bacterium]